jgi:hypothetical protein
VTVGRHAHACQRGRLKFEAKHLCRLSEIGEAREFDKVAGLSTMQVEDACASQRPVALIVVWRVVEHLLLLSAIDRDPPETRDILLRVVDPHTIRAFGREHARFSCNLPGGSSA